MKKFYYFILYIFLLSLEVNSYSVIVYGDDAHKIPDVEISTLLKEFTGPCPLHFLEHPEDIEKAEYADLFSDRKGADAVFIAQKLQEKYPQHTNIKVKAIPTTLWDLATLSYYLRGRGGDTGENREKAEEIGRYLDTHDETLASYKSFAAAKLEEITKHQVAPIVPGNATLLQALLKEHETGDDSVIFKSIEAEVEALNNNKFLIMRSTDGSQTQGLNLLGCVVNNFAKFTTEIQRTDDYPAEPWHSVSELSFSTSLLAGALFDGFNKQVPSACCFERYARKRSNFLATLTLDRKWVLTEGKESVYFQKGTLYPDGITGEGEDFHPRFTLEWGIVQKRDRARPETFSLSINDVFTGENKGHLVINHKDEQWSRPINILTGQFALKTSQLLTGAKILVNFSDTSNEQIRQNHIKLYDLLLRRLTTQQRKDDDTAAATAAAAITTTTQ